MVWTRYGRVFGWLIAVGAFSGMLVLLAISVFLGEDPGEGGWFILVLSPCLGLGMGACTGFVASLGTALCLLAWDRHGRRSVGSRIVMGSAGAVGGAAVPWLVLGLMKGSVDPYGWAGFEVFVVIALFSAIVAVALSGPLIAAAEKRAKKKRLEFYSKR